MPIPTTRPTVTTSCVDCFTYIQGDNYKSYIYYDPDFFTLDGKINVFIKERVLDKINNHFMSRLQAFPDPQFTERYKARLSLAEASFYQMLIRDMALKSEKDLYGGIWSESIERVDGDKSGTSATTGTDRLIGNISNVTNINATTGSQTITDNGDIRRQGNNLTTTSSVDNNLEGARRTYGTATGRDENSGSVNADSVTDSAAFGSSASRAAAANENEASSNSTSGAVNSNFPMSALSSDGTQSVDNFLTGTGAGNVPKYSTSGSKNAGDSSAKTNATNTGDTIGSTGSFATNKTGGVTTNTGINNSDNVTSNISDAVNSSVTSASNVNNGINEAQAIDNVKNVSSRDDYTANIVTGTTNNTRANQLNGITTEKNKTNMVRNETGSSAITADILNKLNDAFANRMSALEYICNYLEPLWNLAFDTYPSTENVVYSDQYPL